MSDESELLNYLRQQDDAAARQAYQASQAQLRHDAVRNFTVITAVGMGQMAWRVWRQTGDPEKAKRGAAIVARTNIFLCLLAVPATICVGSVLGALLNANGDGGAATAAPWFLGAVGFIWAMVAVWRWHKRSLIALVSGPVINATSSPVNTTQALPAPQQYTYDLHTGQFHKHW